MCAHAYPLCHRLVLLYEEVLVGEIPGVEGLAQNICMMPRVTCSGSSWGLASVFLSLT